MRRGDEDEMLDRRDLAFNDFASAEPQGDPSVTRAQLPHLPALDGLRGLAVLAVVLYHLDFGWAQGGFLGVSLFFTLSGFLITSVLLIEHDHYDKIDFKAFWVRRFRRLLPAAWAGVALAVLFGVVAGDPDQIRRLPGDVVGALAEVANWRFILSNDTYTAGYQAPSPLLHYWSLAIEEQFYLFFPPLAALLIRRKAGLIGWAATIGGLMAGSAVATFLLYDPNDTAKVYFSTVTRIAEILAGIGLALVLRGWWLVPARLRTGRRLAGKDPLALAAREIVPLLGLALAFVLWMRVQTTDLWLYRGGFFAVAGVSCLLVAGVLTDGPISRILAFRPFVQLGLISYGVYVYHWPLFAWITTERTGLGLIPVSILRVAATLGLSLLSYQFLERPIRRGEMRLRLTLAWGPALALVLLVAGSFALSSRADERAVDTAAAAVRAAPLITQPPATMPTATTPPDKPKPAPRPPPKKILFLGDSLMHQAEPVLTAKLAEGGAETRLIGGPGQNLLLNQARWLTELEETLVEFQPDVVVLESCCGKNDTTDTWVEDGKRLRRGSDELWGVWERTAEQAIVLAQQHARAVLWTLVPPARTNGYYGPIEQEIARANDITLSLSARHPDMGLLDWRVISGPNGEYVDALPDPEGNLVPVRAKDGFHFAPAGMAILAELTDDAIATTWTANAERSISTVKPKAP